ncbi:MAG: HPr family phosphocarrier protein [Acidobacteriota bacterium]
MREASANVVNRLGLHARAAAKLVRAAAQFKSRITLTEPIRDLTADAKSILSVLTLSASMGKIIIVKAEGEDEERAVESISELFETGFGEL